MPEWVSEWVDVGVAGGTLILALFTFGLASATRRLANEAERSREASEQPRLVAYPTYDEGILHLAVENTGRSMAAECSVTAEFDRKLYDLLIEPLINGSEIPAGVCIRRQLADHIPGVSRSSYTPVIVRCRWRWTEAGREYEQTYHVDPGLALPF